MLIDHVLLQVLQGSNVERTRVITGTAEKQC